MTGNVDVPFEAISGVSGKRLLHVQLFSMTFCEAKYLEKQKWARRGG